MSPDALLSPTEPLAAGRPDEHAGAIATVDAWRASGAAAITYAGARPPGRVAERMDAAARLLAKLAGRLGATLDVAGARLLSERERLSAVAHTPSRDRTLRGSGRMCRAADGWVAVNLARPDDRAAIPALTEGAADSPEGLDSWIFQQRTARVRGRARLLGMAIGVVPERRALAAAAPFAVAAGASRVARTIDECVVLDLSRLWAGPLAGALFAEAGARVRRIVDPDWAPTVDPADTAFEARLNGRKEDVFLPVADRSRVAALVDSADVVITSMREAAVRRLALPVRPDQVWLSITAHGVNEGADRVGFGDDCAADAGLVCWTPDGSPIFAADAIADPITGMLGAVAGMGLLADGRGGRVQLDLRRSARWAMSDGR